MLHRLTHDLCNRDAELARTALGAFEKLWLSLDH